MRFTLRLKIIMIFSFFLIVGGAAWYMNFQVYRQLTYSLQFLEKKDKFLNWILETRRYEKNYFLSGGKDNLLEALDFARRSLRQLADIESDSTDIDVPHDFSFLATSIDKYQKELSELLQYDSRADSTSTDASQIKEHRRHLANVRSEGNFLTTEAEKMVRNQQSHVNRLLIKKKISILSRWQKSSDSVYAPFFFSSLA